MARSVCSACNKCSINHLEDPVDVVPWSIKSFQALDMPCNRSSLSSVVTSRMVDLLSVAHASQAVVTTGVGQRCLIELQARLHARWPWTGIEPRQHIEDVLGIECAGFDHQFHCHQY